MTGERPAVVLECRLPLEREGLDLYTSHAPHHQRLTRDSHRLHTPAPHACATRHMRLTRASPAISKIVHLHTHSPPFPTSNHTDA